MKQDRYGNLHGGNGRFERKPRVGDKDLTNPPVRPEPVARIPRRPRNARVQIDDNAYRHGVTFERIVYAIGHPITAVDVVQYHGVEYKRFIGAYRDALVDGLEIVMKNYPNGLTVIYHANYAQPGFMDRDFIDWIKGN